MNLEDSNNMSGSSAENFTVLIERIRNSDKDAFKDFFHCTHPSIYRFIFRYIGNRETAEDLTQEVFFNFWKHREHINSTLYPKAYLFKIARNLALNHINRHSHKSEKYIVRENNLSLVLSPEDEYDKHFFFDEFQRAINDLPERCRATFILCKYEGFEYSEIAEIMCVSLQTVKNQMNKAIAILRKRLSSHLV